GGPIGAPSISAPPSVNRRKPPMPFSNVLLPQPDGPTTQRISPGNKSRSIPPSTHWHLPVSGFLKTTLTPRRLTVAFFAGASVELEGAALMRRPSDSASG